MLGGAAVGYSLHRVRAATGGLTRPARSEYLKETVVILSEIRVAGLFGRFDHLIALPATERVTIMVAPNGFGKTTILRLIHILFNQDVRALGRTPFRELQVRFTDGSALTATHLAPSDTGERQPTPSVQIDFAEDGEVKESFTPPVVSHDDLRFPLHMIEEWVPSLDQVGSRAWLDLGTGLHLSLEEVLERYGHQLPPEAQLGFEPPDWFRTLQEQVSVRFVQAERLTRPFPGQPYRRHPRRVSASERTVLFSSRDLQRTIQRTLTEYASLAQALDRAFPAELVSQPLQADLTVDELRDKLRQVETKRQQLVDAGFLPREQDELNPLALDLENVEKAKLGVLAIWARDESQKLSVFDSLQSKVETLKRIINSRFLFKRVTVSQEGFVVKAPNGDVLDLATLSSGEQHELVLLYDLLFRVSKDTILMVDEPELSLHVAWQEKFLSDIEEIAELASFRVLLATHSPQIIGDRFDLAVDLGARVEIASPATV